MNCTLEEFKKAVWGPYPGKYIFDDIHPVYGVQTSFVLDTQYEMSLPYADKFRLAQHVWQNGKVIKDNTGLFATNNYAIGTGAFAIANNGNYWYNVTSVNGAKVTSNAIANIPSGFSVGWDPGFEITPKKCECGARSVGSSRHSSWCGIKENL